MKRIFKSSFVLVLGMGLCLLTIVLGVEIHRRRSEVRELNTLAQLYLVSCCIRDYEAEYGELPQRAVKVGGVAPPVSWRVTLLLMNEIGHVSIDEIESSDIRPELSQLVTEKGCPRYRIPGDTGDPSWTSIVCIVPDPDSKSDSNENRVGTTLVAMKNTGIPWTSTKDLTWSEFVEILLSKPSSEFPVYVMKEKYRWAKFTSPENLLMYINTDKNPHRGWTMDAIRALLMDRKRGPVK